MGLKPLTRDDSCNPFNKGNLEEVCGVILNYLSSKNDMDEWKNLTPYQQDGIIDRVSELEENQGLSHGEVIKKYKSKYSSSAM